LNALSFEMAEGGEMVLRWTLGLDVAVQDQQVSLNIGFPRCRLLKMPTLACSADPTQEECQLLLDLLPRGYVPRLVTLCSLKRNKRS
jgi:hypothetical protein